MDTAFRELPDGARQQQGQACIPSEQRTETISRLRRAAPDTARSSAGSIRNKSGTAEVYAPLSLMVGDKGAFFCLHASVGTGLLDGPAENSTSMGEFSESRYPSKAGFWSIEAQNPDGPSWRPVPTFFFMITQWR